MLVYVGIPVIDGKPYATLVDSLLAEQLRGFAKGVHFLVDWEIGCSLIGHARNKLAKRFLDTKEADCIVYVDADISWKRGELIKLAERQEDVIGGTYRGKVDVVKFHVRGPVEVDGNLYRVGGLPGGFLKVSRNALNKIDATQYTDGAGTLLRDYFPTGVHDGTFYGEDYGFCRLWNESGGTVWLDPDIRLKHQDGNRFFEGDPREWLKKVA
jgi:hypothetical protein